MKAAYPDTIPAGATKVEFDVSDEAAQRMVEEIERRKRDWWFDILAANCVDAVQRVLESGGFPKWHVFSPGELLKRLQTMLLTSVSPEDKWGPAGYDAPETPAGSERRYVTPGGMVVDRQPVLRTAEDATPFRETPPQVVDRFILHGEKALCCDAQYAAGIAYDRARIRIPIEVGATVAPRPPDGVRYRRGPDRHAPRRAPERSVLPRGGRSCPA